METMGSMSEFGLLAGGQDFMMQGSYADAAQVSLEDVFGQTDASPSDSGNTAKETEDDIYDWIFEASPVDDDDEEESAGSDAEGLSGLENFAEPNPFARGTELETTVDLNGDFLGSFSFTDMDVEAEILQPQETLMAFEGANVLVAAPSYVVNTSLASLSVEEFSELLPVADTPGANLDLQFAGNAHSESLPAYSNPQPALVQESNEDKFFADLISKEFNASTYEQELLDINFAPNVDAFGGAITHVLAGNKSRVNTNGQPLDTIYEMAEEVVESETVYEQSGSLSNEPSDFSRAYPNNISFDKMFQTETMAAILGVGLSPDESMLDDEPEYTHTAAYGGAGDLVPAFETDKNVQNLSSVPRSFEGNSLSKNPAGGAEFGLKIRGLAALNKDSNLGKSFGQQDHINIQTAIKSAVAKGRKKGPRSPRVPAASTSVLASSSTDRVTKPSGAKPKRPRRVKRVFDYSNANVATFEVPCPELQKIMITREQLIGVCGDQFDEEKAKEGAINRRRFVRESLDGLAGLHPNVAYEKNHLFDMSRPYQQEFTRVELNPTTGAPIMETRSGLCCYCEELCFYELKNSCYSQHMSHSHGVYTDNSLAPDAIMPGDYNLSKKFTPGRKTIPHARDRPGVVCPACLDVVEVRCWSSTSEKKPLTNYLRHFKDQHRVESRRDTFVNLQT